MKKSRKDYFNNYTYAVPKKFDMLFESVIKGTPIFEDIQSNPIPIITNKKLNLITEEICKPIYIVSESTGDCILLEEALFYDENTLICEGILDKVFDAVKSLYEKIKEGIMNVIKESSDAIKAFCEKIMNSRIVKAIRSKLGLDEKINKESFKNAFKVKDNNGKAIATESILDGTYKGQIILETHLAKDDKNAIDSNDVDKIKERLEIWEKRKKGEIKKKDGTPYKKGAWEAPIRELNKALKNLEDEDDDEEGDEDIPVGDNHSESSETPKENNKPQESHSEDGDKSKEKEKGKGKNEPIATVEFNSSVITEQVKSVGEEATSDDKAKAAGTSAAVAEGGDEAKSALDGGSQKGEGEGEDEKPKKESIFKKWGNKFKEKFQNIKKSVGDWFAKQNKWVKYLIWGIIIILAIFALHYLIVGIIWPVLYGLLHGGIVNAAVGVFKLVMAGKTFKATYEQGKKSWETDEGWGKFFMLLAGSVLACITIGDMAAKGQALMQANAASSATSAASAARETNTRKRVIKRVENHKCNRRRTQSICKHNLQRYRFLSLNMKHSIV